MNQEQFIYWLDGFLDGKEVSENPSLRRIKEKFEQIQSFSTFPNQYPAYSGITPGTINHYSPYVTTSSGTPTTTKSDGSNEKQLLTDIKNEG